MLDLFKVVNLGRGVGSIKCQQLTDCCSCMSVTTTSCRQRMSGFQWQISCSMVGHLQAQERMLLQPGRTAISALGMPVIKEVQHCRRHFWVQIRPVRVRLHNNITICAHRVFAHR